MATFTTQRSILRRIALSLNSQNAQGEVMPDAAFTYLCRAETSGFGKQTFDKESDGNYTKDGSSFATESRLIAEQSAFDLTTRLDDFMAGWLLAFVMGQDGYTAGDNPAPNTHIFTWLDSNQPAIVTNVYAEDTSGLKRKWSDMAVSQVVLSGSDKGSITAKATLMGCGVITDGAIAAPPALPTAQYLYGSDSVVSIGPQGAPVSMVPRVLSWEATFDHACELFRAAGGGTKAQFVRYGNPINKLKLVIANDGSHDLRDWQINQTKLEVKIAIVSGATSLTLDYPLVILPNADLGEQDKLVATTVELDQNSILRAAGGQPVTATLMNTQTQYLVAA